MVNYRLAVQCTYKNVSLRGPKGRGNLLVQCWLMNNGQGFTEDNQRNISENVTFYREIATSGYALLAMTYVDWSAALNSLNNNLSS